MAVILLVGGDSSSRTSLAALLRADGHLTYESSGPDEALGCLDSVHVDAMLSDLNVPDANDGLHLLSRTKLQHPDLPVILYNGFERVSDVVTALKTGTRDYLVESLDPDTILSSVRSAVGPRRASAAVAAAAAPARPPIKVPPGVIAADPATRTVFAKACRIADSEIPILITGESGTGKEILARTIYRQSRRREMQFVPVNCGAVPEALVESELFGHGRGAFTGAVAHKKGLVEDADGGVLFLDEIGEMPAYAQVCLLRFLDSGEFRRVGETALRRSNVRIIAATNRDLASDVRAGRFREDLFYRLGVICLRMPGLRDRPGDIMALAEHYAGEITSRLGLPVRGFTPDVRAMLESYAWPGNVRELRSVIEAAAVLAGEGMIGRTHLPKAIGHATAPESGDVDHDDRGRMMTVLQQCDGNRLETARALGISRATLWRRLRRMHLSRPAETGA